MKYFFGLLLFRGLYHDMKESIKELWNNTFPARKNYMAAMSLNRYEWLMGTKLFHDLNTLRTGFLEDGSARMR